MEELKKAIREIPDFPKPGILFYDITTLLRDARPSPGRSKSAAAVSRPQGGRRRRHRGPRFHLRRGGGLQPRGRLHCRAQAAQAALRTVSRSYQLEYGTDTLEMHEDAVRPGDRILLIDDLIATGGTARAVAEMIEAQGGQVAGAGFVVELEFLNGRQALPGLDVFSLLKYQQ